MCLKTKILKKQKGIKIQKSIITNTKSVKNKYLIINKI